VQTFDAIFTITQGGPGAATTNLPYEIYLTMFRKYEYGEAAAAGVVVVIGTIIVATFRWRDLVAVQGGGLPMTAVLENRSSTPPPAATGRRRRRKAKGDPAASAGIWWAIGAWIATLVFFAPVAWMVLTSLHNESDAATNPPSVFAPVSMDTTRRSSTAV
jgi:ABC-type glycerol-3-phosphate transport system permease component